MSSSPTATASSRGTVPTVRPYAPSWFDRLLGWVDGLPGPVWFYLILLALGQWLYVNAMLWYNGKLLFGSFDFLRSFSVILVPYTLGFWLYERRIASNALHTFRSLLPVDDAGFARLEYELFTLPAPFTALLTLSFFIASIAFHLLLPPSIVRDYAPTRESFLWQYTIVTVPAGILSLIGVYRAVYQLRQVTRLHRMASSINLYESPPLYAFSSVTATIAIGLLLPAYFIFAARPEMTLGSPLLFGGLVIAVLVAIAAFVLPLREMHNRIKRERARLLVEVNRRIEILVGRVHRAVDADEFQDMENWNRALSTLIIEREVISNFTTWPWERGTVTGFISALVLPIVLWVITRLLEQWL